MDHYDLLDGLLDVEEGLYQEGYDLGIADGLEAGYTEGSVFAVEKGFEKFLEMGRLYGKSLVWAQRLVSRDDSRGIADNANPPEDEEDGKGNAEPHSLGPSACDNMAPLAQISSRLAKNINSLVELVDPASLAVQNTEDAISDAEERYRGALVKAKLIQRVLGECEGSLDLDSDPSTTGDGTANIEDISSLTIRH